jgi:hypothetical protein
MSSLAVAGPSSSEVTDVDLDERAFDCLWADATRVYQDRTGINLNDDTELSRCLTKCKTEADVLDVIEDSAKTFSKYREGIPRLNKLRGGLKLVIRVVLL